MNLEQLRSLFPLEGEITQEIIDSSDVDDRCKCIGVNTLTTAILKKSRTIEAENWMVTWGNTFGHLIVDNDKHIVRTIEDIGMMTVKKPQKVTFIL